MKDIINKNYKGKLHGYQEWYGYNAKLHGKCFFNNGIRVDYEEWYYSNGRLKKTFYI